MAVWLVRCGRHGEGESVALGDGVVGIGSPEAGDLGAAATTDEVREILEQQYPDAKPTTISNWTGQVDAFVSRIQVGDLVALPLKTSPAVAFGRVTAEYEYVPKSLTSMRHHRRVQWIRQDMPRDAIDQDLRYSLGAYMTVCRISRNNAEERIQALLEGKPHPPAPVPPEASEPVESEAEIPVDLGELARDQIRQRLAERFSGHDFARLIGQVLEAEGFVTDISPAGPDGGGDILAGEGGMGFDGATLAVQVKSGSQVVDAGTLRELQGVMANFGASRGLLVSWEGSPKSRGRRPAGCSSRFACGTRTTSSRGCRRPTDRLPAETQAEVPLRRVWTLVPEDSE